MNEAIAFEERNFKRKESISACYTGNGVAHIKKTECSKTQQFYHMYELWKLFQDDINYENDEGQKLFHNSSEDASNSIQPSCCV